jgi:hypothetical protein
LNEFQKRQPRESAIFHAENANALKRVIDETDVALRELEAFCQEAFVAEKA